MFRYLKNIYIPSRGSPLSPNNFTKFWPFAVAAYLGIHGQEMWYVSHNGGDFVVRNASFEDIMGMTSKDFVDPTKTRLSSVGGESKYDPPWDVTVERSGEIRGWEVKCVVTPHSSGKDAPEMIFRQVTPFQITRSLVKKWRDMSVLPHEDPEVKRMQSPLMLKLVWKTRQSGLGHEIEPERSLDLYAYSDFALINMISQKESQERRLSKVTRAMTTMDTYRRWSDEWRKSRKMTYKEEKRGHLEHLKVAFSPTEMVGFTKNKILKLRFDAKEVLPEIFEPEAIRAIEPIRDADQLVKQFLLQKVSYKK